MAATGIIRVKPWVEPGAAQREALTLETVKLALELGSDLNTANTDGRTALDGARALKYDSVVSFLVEKGAKPGTGNPAGRGGRGAAGRQTQREPQASNPDGSPSQTPPN